MGQKIVNHNRNTNLTIQAHIHFLCYSTCYTRYYFVANFFMDRQAMCCGPLGVPGPEFENQCFIPMLNIDHCVLSSPVPKLFFSCSTTQLNLCVCTAKPLYNHSKTSQPSHLLTATHTHTHLPTKDQSICMTTTWFCHTWVCAYNTKKQMQNRYRKG